MAPLLEPLRRRLEELEVPSPVAPGRDAVNDENRPVIDYDHCKGCMICVAVCPSHAISPVPERDADEATLEDA